MRWLGLIAIMMSVPGCAMPAAFTVASFALDTGSYGMSGKTLTDHGLSLATEKDCSVMRLLEDESEVCREHQDYEVVDTILTPLPEGDDPEVGLNQSEETMDSPSYAQLAQRVHEARVDNRNYLTAGMMATAI